MYPISHFGQEIESLAIPNDIVASNRLGHALSLLGRPGHAPTLCCVVQVVLRGEVTVPILYLPKPWCSYLKQPWPGGIPKLRRICGRVKAKLSRGVEGVNKVAVAAVTVYTRPVSAENDMLSIKSFGFSQGKRTHWFD